MWTTQASEKGTEESNVVNIGISNTFFKIHEANKTLNFKEQLSKLPKDKILRWDVNQ